MRILVKWMNRYKNHLDPTLNKGRFTDEEKKTLMRIAGEWKGGVKEVALP